MFSVMPTPIFADFQMSAYQPAARSPLSSPIQASSPPAPLSPCDPNSLPRRQVHSSPIRGPPGKFFRFAARPALPNPVLRSREVVQQNRRDIFLRNVQQRKDDQRWERRGVEQKLLSAEWFNMNRERQRAKGFDVDGFITEADIADAERLQEEHVPDTRDDPEEMLVDAMLHEEDAEIEAFLSSSSQQPTSSAQSEGPDSSHWSDDEDYDALFVDFISHENGSRPSGDVTMMS